MKVFDFLGSGQVIVLNLSNLFKNNYEIHKLKFFWHYKYNENHKVVGMVDTK